MLKGISPLLSPELLKVQAEMGHGDRLVIGDANFAAAAMAREHILVRADGVPSDALAGAVLELFPLDEWAPAPVILMGVKDGNGALQPLDQCRKIRQVVAEHDPKAAARCQVVDRAGFYEQARSAYAVVAAGEANRYGCVIFQKGIC